MTQDQTVADIVQIEEAGSYRANQLLAQGYRLLLVDSKVFETPRKNIGPGLSATYIRRDFRYAVGRRADQEPFPPQEPRGSRLDSPVIRDPSPAPERPRN